MLLQSKYGYLKTQRMAKLLKEETESISKPMVGFELFFKKPKF